MSNKLVQLKQFIAIHYNMDELRSLCFELNVDYEELGEGGKTAKIRELLLLLGNQCRYSDLLAQLEEDRKELFHEADFDTTTEIEEALYSGLPSLKKQEFLTDRDLRDRFNVLRNVETTWIDGFLKQSLHMEIFKLTHTYQAEAVSRSWSIALRQPGQEDSVVPVEKPLREVFDDYGRRLLILGAPGSGKTITLLQLAQQLIQEAYNQPGLPIPVVLNLSSWARKREPLEDWVIEEMFTQYQVARRISQAWVSDGQLLYLLDGLDEVAEVHRDDCLVAINQFLEEHPAEIVVCSRTEDYERLSHRLNLSIASQIEPLTKAEIEHYLSRDELGLTAVKNTLKTDSDLYELAQSPLMLSIMTLAYRDVSQEELGPLNSMEARRHHLFSYYANSVFIHRPLVETAGFTKEQAFGWLANLAHEMKVNSLTIFHLELLQPASLPSGKYHLFKALLGLIGGLIVGLLTCLLGYLLHQIVVNSIIGAVLFFLSSVLSITVSVWFSATIKNKWARFLISGLSCWLLLGLLSGLLGILISKNSTLATYYTDWVYVLYIGLFVGMFPVLIIGLLPSLAAAIISYFSDIENVQIISIFKPSGGTLLKNTGRGCIVGWLFGLFTGLFTGIIFGLLFGFVGGVIGLLIGILVFGFLFPLIFGLLSGLLSFIKPRSTTKILFPNQGVRSSLINAIRMSLFFGFLAGMFALLINFGLGRTVFVFIILVMPITFLYYGGATVLQHITLRLLLSRYNILPLRLIIFCDEMTNHIILRRVGGGWVFIHRYLLEYFASLHEDSDSTKALIETSNHN